ncbi:MAG: hypothetical protein WAK91_18865, partial [Candidatus Acidiferrales bacterium]
PKLLETAVNQTKQTTELVSNRYKTGGPWNVISATMAEKRAGLKLSPVQAKTIGAIPAYLHWHFAYGGQNAS